MKTILVPVDFSENSLNAIRYAMALNKKIKAKIILFHSFVLPVYATDVPLAEVDEEEFRDETLNELNKLRTKFQSKYPDTTMDIEVSTSQGFAEDTIMKMADTVKPDFVMMGTKGAGGLRKALIGTITAGVLENINCPVITVPKDARFTEPKKIVFSTNYALNDFENIGRIIEFGKQFNAEIILLHIANGDFDRSFEFNAIERFREHMKEESKYEKITFKLMENSDILTSLNIYLEEIKADMVAMTTRHRNFFQKLFSRSMTKEMAYHSHIPLMVFHEGEEINIP